MGIGGTHCARSKSPVPCGSVYIQFDQCTLPSLSIDTLCRSRNSPLLSLSSEAPGWHRRPTQFPPLVVFYHSSAGLQLAPAPALVPVPVPVPVLALVRKIVDLRLVCSHQKCYLPYKHLDRPLPTYHRHKMGIGGTHCARSKSPVPCGSVYIQFDQCTLPSLSIDTLCRSRNSPLLSLSSEAPGWHRRPTQFPPLVVFYHSSAGLQLAPAPAPVPTPALVPAPALVPVPVLALALALAEVLVLALAVQCMHLTHLLEVRLM